MSVIRVANESDFPRLMELYGQLHPDDPTLASGEDRAVFYRILSSDNLVLFVFEDDDGDVQATCYLNTIPNITRRAAPYGIIENVVTEQVLRGEGIGKMIIRHALQYAWDNGCYKVMLQTGSKRVSTHNFYKSCGFDCEEKFGYIARPSANFDP